MGFDLPYHCDYCGGVLEVVTWGLNFKGMLVRCKNCRAWKTWKFEEIKEELEFK